MANSGKPVDGLLSTQLWPCMFSFRVLSPAALHDSMSKRPASVGLYSADHAPHTTLLQSYHRTSNATPRFAPDMHSPSRLPTRVSSQRRLPSLHAAPASRPCCATPSSQACSHTRGTQTSGRTISPMDTPSLATKYNSRPARAHAWSSPSSHAFRLLSRAKVCVPDCCVLSFSTQAHGSTPQPAWPFAMHVQSPYERLQHVKTSHLFLMHARDSSQLQLNQQHLSSQNISLQITQG